jgi:glutaredoxin 3
MISGVIQDPRIGWGTVMVDWSLGRSDVVIYTRDLCVYCDKAKKEIKERGWKYTEHNISDPEIKKELFEKAPDAKTVPQIWVGQRHVGGYDDLVKYFEETLGW